LVKVEFRESSATKKEIRVEVAAAEVDEKLKTELVNLQQTLKMPGFRKGKVPAEIVRRKFARSVRREVAERIVRETCLDAIRRHDLRPIAPPEIRDLEFEDGQPLTYQATVEVWPQVQLKPWRGLKVTRERAPVPEDRVETRLQVLRELHRELLPVERPAQTGDFLIVDYDVYDEGEKPLEGRGVRNYLVELGAEGLLKEFEEGLAGVRAGESRTIHAVFPEEGPHPEVAGRRIKFWVKVNAIKQKRLPELDDNFAKELGNFDRLEDVKKEIRAGLEREADLDADRRAREALVDLLIRENTFEVPESMVGNLLEAFLSDAEKQWRGDQPFDREKASSALKPVAVRQAKRFVVLREIARTESLEVKAEEVDRRIHDLALRGQRDPAEVRKALEAEGSIQDLRSEILEEKALSLLLDAAEVTTVEREGEGATEGGRSA